MESNLGAMLSGRNGVHRPTVSVINVWRAADWAVSPRGESGGWLEHQFHGDARRQAAILAAGDDGNGRLAYLHSVVITDGVPEVVELRPEGAEPLADLRRRVNGSVA